MTAFTLGHDDLIPGHESFDEIIYGTANGHVDALKICGSDISAALSPLTLAVSTMLLHHLVHHLLETVHVVVFHHSIGLRCEQLLGVKNRPGSRTFTVK